MSSGPRPKVLFVGRGAPWRGGAGYLVREAMFLDAFTRFADVTAAMFRLDADDAEAGVAEGRCERVVSLPVPHFEREGKWARLFNDTLRATPRSFRGFDAGMARAVIGQLDPEAFDAVFCYRIDTAAWAGLLGRRGLLLDIDDPEHARIARRIEMLGETPDTRSAKDLVKLERFEKRAAQSARVAFVCQPIDRDRFDEPKPEVAPNAVPTPEECPAYDPDPDTLLFVGNLDGGTDNPNVEGLLWFLDRVWPLVIERRPSAALRIGGKTSAVVDEKLDGFARGVALLGFVPDMAVAVQSAAVNLAPIRFGTGTRIKVLDALAQGGAVVGTALGCEGIDVVDGEHVRLADSPEGFAAACAELLENPSTAAELGRNGHGLVSQRYSTAVHVPRLSRRLGELLGVDDKIDESGGGLTSAAAGTRGNFRG